MNRLRSKTQRNFYFNQFLPYKGLFSDSIQFQIYYTVQKYNRERPQTNLQHLAIYIVDNVKI